MSQSRLVLGVATLALLSGCARAGFIPTAEAVSMDAAFQAQGVANQVATEVLAADRAAFDGFDANHDGALTHAEVPFLQADNFLAHDANHDGVLSYAESKPSGAYVKQLTALVGKSLAAYFKKQDADHDGKLSAAEAPELVVSRGGAIAPEQLLAAFAAADATLAPARGSAKPPVEMIPGFVMPIHTFYPIRSALAKAGYTDMTIMNQWPWFGRIEEYAAIARMHVDGAKKRTGSKKVEVIGHSMGGLTARTLVKYGGGDKDVAHVVTMGTPHHGTVLGNLGGIALPSCKEMSLGSPFLKALNEGDETPGQIPYTSIHCSWDEIVIPGSSVDLEGADNPKVDHTFHIEMMFDPTTIQLVLDGLNK